MVKLPMHPSTDYRHNTPLRKRSEELTAKQRAARQQEKINRQAAAHQLKLDKAEYEENKLHLMQHPDNIVELFHTCYKEQHLKSHPAHYTCHVWVLETRTGALSLIGGQPRFGPGALHPRNLILARRFIYAVTFTDKYDFIDKWNGRLRMMDLCLPMCVNPKHMDSPLLQYYE